MSKNKLMSIAVASSVSFFFSSETNHLFVNVKALGPATGDTCLVTGSCGCCQVITRTHTDTYLTKRAVV